MPSCGRSATAIVIKAEQVGFPRSRGIFEERENYRKKLRSHIRGHHMHPPRHSYRGPRPCLHNCAHVIQFPGLLQHSHRDRHIRLIFIDDILVYEENYLKPRTTQRGQPATSHGQLVAFSSSAFSSFFSSSSSASPPSP